jgi:hypothetical protein
LRLRSKVALVASPFAAFGIVILVAALFLPATTTPGGEVASQALPFRIVTYVVWHHAADTGAPSTARLNLPNPMFAFCGSGPRYGSQNVSQAPTSCVQGWSYWQDPTTVMTNQGHEFFGCKFFNSFATITCTATDFAQYMMLSTSSNTPAVTDTACPATTYTTGNLADVAGTITNGGASGGSETWTITHTWTSSTNGNAVSIMCLNTELHTGTNIILVVEGQIGPDTLNTNDQLVGTFSFTAT